MTRRPSISALSQTLLDTCLCHQTRMAARVITRAYDEALRPTGLRATQVSVLAAAGVRGAVSISSLAESLAMERTTLTRNLRPLEQKGYVQLAAEGQRRRRMLTLTAAGRAALVSAVPLWKQSQRRFGRRLARQRWPVVHDALAALTRESRPGRRS